MKHLAIVMTKEEKKERLEEYPTPTLRQLAEDNIRKADEAREVAEVANQIIQERRAA